MSAAGARAAPAEDGVPSRRGRPLLALLAVAATFAVLVSLGWWQIERKAWKEGLIAQIETRAHGVPQAIVPEAEWPRWRAADDEFRRVRLEGTFEPSRTVALHGLAEERRGQPIQGFYLFVPLVRPDGSTVVVNRGFVPTELRDATLARLAQAPAQASVVGLVRAPETRGMFVPENLPDRGQWFVRNLDDMAKAGGLSRVAPFYVDADATPNEGGWPRGGQTQIVLRNNHLGYALTWFGLAATLVGVVAAAIWGRRSARAETDSPRRPARSTSS